MRIATTAVLGVTALALGAAIHRVDHAPVSGSRAAELARVLLRFEPEAVEQITVERGVEKTVLTKRQGAWFFSEPEEDRADATVALALLDRLNHLGIVEDLDLGPTIATALRLHPKTRTLVVINDRTQTGSGNRQMLDAVLPGFSFTHFTPGRCSRAFLTLPEQTWQTTPVTSPS